MWKSPESYPFEFIAEIECHCGKQDASMLASGHIAQGPVVEVQKSISFIETEYVDNWIANRIHNHHS